MPTRERMQRNLFKTGKAHKRKLTDFFTFSRGEGESQTSPIVASSSSEVEQASSPTSSPAELVDQKPCICSSTVEEQQPRKRARLHGGHKVGFNPEWQRNRPWLQVKVTVGEQGERLTSMICSICQKFNTSPNCSRTWVDSGCRTLRLDKVKGHETSNQHKTALALSMSETLPDARRFFQVKNMYTLGDNA